MLRNTFAVELLKKGVSLEHVAILLADTPKTVPISPSRTLDIN
jgi:hypothetical protein